MSDMMSFCPDSQHDTQTVATVDHGLMVCYPSFACAAHAHVINMYMLRVLMVLLQYLALAALTAEKKLFG